MFILFQNGETCEELKTVSKADVEVLNTGETIRAIYVNGKEAGRYDSSEERDLEYLDIVSCIAGGDVEVYTMDRSSVEPIYKKIQQRRLIHNGE